MEDQNDRRKNSHPHPDLAGHPTQNGSSVPQGNCRSQNEFVEEAIRFYSDYVTTQEVTDFLPPIFLHAMRATLQGSEDRICRLLFKLTVEIGVLASLALSSPAAQAATSITATLSTQPIYADGQRVESPSWDQIRPGDLIRSDNSSNGHVVVVVKKTDEYIKVTESGLNNKVRRGGIRTPPVSKTRCRPLCGPL